MAITDSFRKAADRRDITALRIMMKNSLLEDPTFTEFEEMKRYIGNLAGLYDDHDGRDFIYDKSLWDDDYMNKLMVQVVGNFSQKRIDHLKEVVRYLRPVVARQKQADQGSGSGTRQTPAGDEAQPRSRDSREQKHEYERERPYDRGVKIAGGAAVGGVFGGTIAGIAGGSVFVGAITGAVVVGAIVAIATREIDEDE